MDEETRDDLTYVHPASESAREWEYGTVLPYPTHCGVVKSLCCDAALTVDFLGKCMAISFDELKHDFIIMISIDNYNSYWLNCMKIEILEMCNRTIKSYLLPQHFNRNIEVINKMNKLIIIFLVAKCETSKKRYHILLNVDACFSSAIVIWQLSNR